jgi:hypothetical protein
MDKNIINMLDVDLSSFTSENPWFDALRVLRQAPPPAHPDEPSDLIIRDSFLFVCGFASYGAYLTSDLWTTIREWLSRHSWANECLACEARFGLQWHHRNYLPSTLVGNFSVTEKEPWRSPIVRLCGRCHEIIHYENHDFIHDWERVDRRLDRLPRELSEPQSKPFAKGWDSVEQYDAFD